MSVYNVREATVREPAVAGRFYPADAPRLRAMVREYLDEAVVPALGQVRAVIAPHAGYIYSGPVAGYAFKVWEGIPQRPRTIYLMGPAHFVFVSGIAVGKFSAFSTPLGTVPVAGELVDALLEYDGVFTLNNEAHMPEHSLEVELPFLQEVFSNQMRIVPLLFGHVDPMQAVPVLVDLVQADPNALIVVSSDLSHYHDYWTARRLDTALIDAIVANDLEAAREGEACGLMPILALMGIASRLGWTPRLLDYRNSGDTAGDKMRVVGYAAIAYTA